MPEEQGPRHDHGTYLDRMGIGISSLCMIHCLAMPFLFMAAPLLVAHFHALHIHLILALLILPIGLAAFAMGFRRHKQRRVLIFGAVGLIIVGLMPLILEQLNVELTPTVELCLMIPGSGFMIYSHYQNQRCHC